LPRHNLLLLCDEAGSEAHSLMRYDLGREEWVRVLDGRHFSQIFALPQQQDVLLLESLPEDEGVDEGGPARPESCRQQPLLAG
jgi:hypothetical protein